DHLVIMGANPHASQGSLIACPDFLGRLGDLRRRGGKAVVIDPRRTGTARRAHEWVPIRPGTDAALLMAWVHVLFEEQLVRPGRLAALTSGIDDVRALCRPFTPEAVAATCAIPAATIRRLVRELAPAPRAAGEAPPPPPPPPRPSGASSASWPPPRARRCTGASAPATRSSAPSHRGWSRGGTCSRGTSPLRGGPFSPT